MKGVNRMVLPGELAERFANLRVLLSTFGALPPRLDMRAWFTLERRRRC